jgi:hypothetical protein
MAHSPLIGGACLADDVEATPRDVAEPVREKVALDCSSHFHP